MIDTAKSQCRQLHFQTIEDVRREILRILDAEHEGTLERSGNWSPGQAFNHLAAWIEFGYEGYPPELRLPWYLRHVLRVFGPHLARRAAQTRFPRGSTIPNVPGGTWATDDVPSDEGAATLLTALDRLDSGEARQYPSPIFGNVDAQTDINIHLRHAELHLGYFWPDGMSQNVEGQGSA